MKNIKQLIAENIATEKESIAEHEEIKAILQGLIGKPFDRRTFSANRLQGFELEVSYSMFHIVGKNRHLIGYNSSPFVDVVKFEEYDACNGSAAQKRIEKMQALDVDRLQTIQDNIANGFDLILQQFVALEKEKLDSYNNPVYYEMLQAVYDEDHGPRSARVVLSDFYYIAQARGAK